MKMHLILLPFLMTASLLAQAGTQAPETLLFIDERVPDPQAFLRDRTDQTRAILIRSHEDGLRQIAAATSAHRGLKAIHLVAHGEPGALAIGSSGLDLATIRRHPSMLSALGDSLAPDGDILLYGCNVAQAGPGRAFVAALSAATRADVAASANATGSHERGGDWVLEVASGPIESAPIEQSADEYPFLLDPTDLAGAGAWTTLHRGSQFDTNGDTQANKAGTEIVGDTAHATTYANYDDNGTTGGVDPELDDILSMRVRIGDETKATHSSYAFFGFDADADDKLDGFVSSGAGTTSIWDAGTDLNLSPATTDVANSPYTSYAQTAANYNFATVSAANDPDWDGNADLNADGNTDVFVSLLIPVVDLDAFLATQGIIFTPSTQLRFVSLTATQTNALNSDFNGVSDSTTSDWTQSFATLGLYSDPVDSTGVVDTTPPATPTVTSQTTNDSTPTVSGTAEAASTVDVVINGVTYSTIATGGGTWSITVPAVDALGDNTYDVGVTSTDGAGNSSTDATTNELVIDSAAPATPTVTSQTTNDSTPTVSGTAEAASTVDVVINGVTYSTTATGGGTWSITLPAVDALGDNTYDVGVTSTDGAGNSSTDATTNELSIDTTPPVVAIGSAPAANMANAASYPVSGTCTDGDGNVAVDVTGATPVSQSVSCASGGWSATFDVSAITDGNNAVAVAASQTDAAGNTGTDAQSADKDATAPTLSITDNGSGGDDNYSPAEAAMVSLSGTTDAEDGRIVTVSFSDGVNAPVGGTATATGGTWTTTAADISGLNTGTISITADVNDAAGNAAAQATDTVTYTSAGQPLLTADDVPASSNSFPTFSGTTDQPPAQIVTVSDDLGKELCTAMPVVGSPVNTWSCTTASAISEGTYTFTAEVDNGLGNTQLVSFAVGVDLDADDDGLPDAVEGAADTDGDGVPDFQDPDSDNDGIPDADEDTGLPPLSGTDSDGDGLDDAIDVDATGGTDVDGNGIDDSFETSDLDGDGVPDYLDTDTDDDGIPDLVEGSGDSDGDGMPDFTDTDSDNDGIPDAVEDGSTPPLTGNDSDFDGIDDAIDVDSTGGDDLNGDGIDDAFTPTDTDGDGIPDHVDRDSNSDGVPDAFGSSDTPPPGASDSDGDGLPDYLETDSDGDGIPDTVETDVSGTDSDFDGIDDAFDVDQTGGTDADGDGIDDGVPPDFDNDGVPNLQDLDSDNDGVFDVNEAGLPDDDGDGRVDDSSTADPPPDADGSGGPDYLDLDSDGDGTNDIVGTTAEPFDGDGDGQIDLENIMDTDGDGIPDVIDPTSGGPVPSVDTDGDGVPDAADIDDDNDGIPDGVETTDGNDRDTDGDGLVDRLDPDSDGDGIPDSIEGWGSDTNDLDGDGVMDDTADSNGDGLADLVPESMLPVDTDRDGTPDFQDLDSDGDNLADSVENGDFDADGIPDYLQADGGLETAVTGSGAGSMDILSIILLGFWLALRRYNTSYLGLPLVLVLLGTGQFSSPAQAADNCTPGSDMARLSCWYLGAGVGFTRVDPEGESNGWRTSDANSEGFKLLVGYRFRPRWFAELAYTNAGEAELDNLNPAITGTPKITYDVASMYGGYWLREPQSKWNLYGKAGVAAIWNEATDNRVDYDKQTSVQLALGLGGQWRITPTWFARFELDAFDRDARYFGLSVGFDLGQ
jgi:hypothetical protein